MTASSNERNKSDYDRMLLEVLEPDTRFYQFGVKKPLPTGEGTSVVWNRPTRLSLGQKLTQGVKPSANALSTAKVSALIETYGGYVIESDVVDLTSITDVMTMATERLARQAAETIDRAVMHAIIFHADTTGVSAVHVGKHSSRGLVISTDITAPSYVRSTHLIAVSDVRACASELRRRNAVPYDGENFVGIIHPVIEEDLTSDSTWQNWHRRIGAIVKRLTIKNLSKLRGHPKWTIRSQPSNGRFNDYEEIYIYGHIAWYPIG